MSSRCDIVIDTSIVWAVAEHKAQKAVRRFFGVLRETHAVCYTEYTLFELEILGYTGFRVRSILNSIAEPRRAGIDRAVAYRYKATKKIGANDVLIALSARKLEAVLATGDWPQAKFYMNQTGKKPIYIPLQQL